MTARVGLIARMDGAGLHWQTGDFYRWMQPERTLVVDMSKVPSNRKRPANRPHDYPDRARFAAFDGHRFTDDECDWILTDIDVLFSAETIYDWRLFDLARSRGIRTAVHVNPEFFRWGRELDLPKPDVIVAPTTWRLDQMRKHAEVEWLPVPVDRTLFPPRLVTSASVFLHPVGMAAAADRNGTQLVARAIRTIRSPVTVRVTSQTPTHPVHGSPNVTVDVREGDVADRQDLYDGADVLLLPRRYGGNCLPAYEAASLGMPVVMLNIPPQNEWLPAETLVQARIDPPMKTQAGPIDLYRCRPERLAAVVDRLASDPAFCALMSKESDVWAESLSWQRWAPIYRTFFDEVASG